MNGASRAVSPSACDGSPHTAAFWGEEPADARIVQVKSPAAFRAAYEELADEIAVIESPGISSPKLDDFVWHRLRRPIYPLDPDTVFP